VPTPQSQAISGAEVLINAAESLMVVYNLMAALDNQWNDIGMATTLAAMQTASLNADGSLSTTVDTTPNTAHPIVALPRALSSTQLAQIKTIADAVVSLLNGNAVSAQGGARAILNAAVGG